MGNIMNSPIPKDLMMPLDATREGSIGRILLDMGKISIEDAEVILRVQREKGLRFGEAAKELGLIIEEDIQRVLAHQFDYPYLHSEQNYFPRDLIAAYQPFSAQVEALRAIRSQLMLRWFSAGHKSLAIACIDDEGKTGLFAANLAVVFSQLGEQTLLVDANMRTPYQHNVFNLSAGKGLSDILVERADLSAIAKIESFVDLSLLQAGTLPPNPQELIGRPSLGELTKNLVNLYDVVLYDVPPIKLAADALTLSSRLGGVLLVARKNHTRLSEMKTAIQQFESMGVMVVGSVLADF
jgi:protein-tyrosine kinase